MKVRFACLTMGLALAVAAQPAAAADWNNGGESIKDMSGSAGVPVPAPVPVADYAAEWYIGVVTGGVLVDDSTIDNVGSEMPVIESDHLAKTMFGGISAGRYLTPTLRAEIAFDFYDDFRVAGPHESYFGARKSAKGDMIDVSQGDTTVSVQTYDTNHYTVTRTDTVRVGRTTGMFNMLLDLPMSARIKPYVGAGVGVTWRSMKRRANEVAYCTHTTNSHITGLPTDTCAVNTEELPATFRAQSEDNTDRFDVALAAMAGVSIELTPSILWDNGYQMLWESNSIQITSPTVSGESTVSYGDTIQHQFRTGLRFLID